VKISNTDRVCYDFLIDIPTIPMDEGDGDDAIDLTPQVAVAPE
jgi:hypothetical protein